MVNWAWTENYLDVRERERERERGINNDLVKSHKVKISNLLPSLTRLMCVCLCLCKNGFYVDSVIGGQRYFLCLESLSIHRETSTQRVASNVKYP